MKTQNKKNPVTLEGLVEVLQDYPTKKELKDTIKKELSNYPTKQDLKVALSNYPTKQDLKDTIKQELSNYPTKQDLNRELSKRLTSSFDAFRGEMDYRFQLFREDYRAEFSKFSNLILTAIDPLLKELETRREDREISNAQTEEVRAQIDNHEKRITKLEHS